MKKSTPPLLAAVTVLVIATTAGLAAASGTLSAAADPPPAPTPSQTLGPDPLPDTGVVPLPEPTGSLGPEPSPVPEPALSGVPADPDLPMPLDPFMTSMRGIHTIDLAKDAGAAECMRSLGFSAWTAGVVRNWSPEDYIEADVLEPVDGATAAQAGYPRTAPDPAVAAAAEETEDQRGATQEEMQALDGTADTTASGVDIPEGGCESDAADRIFGAADTLPADPRLLADDADFLALEHSAVQQALAAWVTCMTGKGYGYDSPMSARADIEWAGREAYQPAGAREKRVAADDAACAQETGLFPTYRQAKRAYEQILVDERRQELTTSLAVFDTWVSRAEAVLAAG
ncbi:hypothetical protein [Nonomuraea harbinensis]|uniref:DUF4439 domain-containing protein n=1 Tax=Nonomuraea harbinensis TaxID=1286938 RepID=A0ABW1C6R5_9ACTN|nr:hypothetical protein [Nonomuraea harbinensis]